MFSEIIKSKTTRFVKEDDKTYQILGNLLLCDDILLKYILFSSCKISSPDDIYKNSCKVSSPYDIYKSFGYLEHFEFWPKWQHFDNHRVEPDLFLKFENLAVIIEVKVNDVKGLQKETQWKREAEAYFSTYCENLHEQKNLIIIALGGNDANDIQTLEVKSCLDTARIIKVFKCSWLDIYQTTLKLKHQKNNININQRLIDHLCFTFSICDLYSYKELTILIEPKLNLSLPQNILKNMNSWHQKITNGENK